MVFLYLKPILSAYSLMSDICKMELTSATAEADLKREKYEFSHSFDPVAPGQSHPLDRLLAWIQSEPAIGAQFTISSRQSDIIRMAIRVK